MAVSVLPLTRLKAGRDGPAGQSALRDRDPAGYVRQDNPVVRSFTAAGATQMATS